MGARSWWTARAIGAVLVSASLAGCSDGDDTEADAFALTDPTVSIVATDDGPALRIAGTVANISDEVLDDVAVAVVLDEALDAYIPAGAATLPVDGVDRIYPAGTPHDEVPEDGALGIEVGDTRHLDGTGDYLAEVVDLADEVVLQVTWDGGEQVLTAPAEVLDPDGLVAR
ncbi:hypothetical protein QQX09_00615 [Demequina sp. SYSU T00192]|uniref:Copper chaperone PCu(A)C n=1 Tax=Demequina litoralis TaxID=3051660 RepID=A0ABT8G6L5_9MICO|nr:hypothetical protein [Demequina sp. SYSU T00192]MDN4474349.1 hypothetical protein [Demequina sp. SYSU T00192]